MNTKKDEEENMVSLQVGGVVTVYDSIEDLLASIDVNWDVASVCLHYQGKVRWVFKEKSDGVRLN